MITLLDNDYTAIHDMAYQADQAFSQQRFAACIELSTKTLEKISNHREKKFLSNLYKDKNALTSMCFYMRAKCSAALVEIDAMTQRDAEKIREDYRCCDRALEQNEDSELIVFDMLAEFSEFLLAVAHSAAGNASYVNEAFEVVTRAERIIKTYEIKRGYDYTLVKARKAACHSLYLDGNQHYDLDQAISGFEEAHTFFSQPHQEDSFDPSALKSNLIMAKLRLAECYQSRSNQNQNTNDSDRAAMLYTDLLNLLPDDDDLKGVVSSRIGRIASRRAGGSRHFNAESALEMLEFSSHSIDKEKYPFEWINTNLDLTSAMIKLLESRSHLSQNQHLKKRAFEVIDELEKLSEKNFEPALAFQILRTKARFQGFFGGTNQEEQLKDMLHLASLTKNDDRYEDLHAQIIFDVAGIVPPEGALKFIEEVHLTGEALINEPIAFELYALKACKHLDLYDISSAAQAYQNALKVLAVLRSQHERHMIPQIKRYLIPGQRNFLWAGNAIYEAEGDPYAALAATELLRLSSLTPVLEELLIMELQVDRRRWVAEWSKARQYQITLMMADEDITSVDGAEHDQIEQDRLTKAHTSWRKQADGKIAFVEQFYKSFGEISDLHTDHLENQYVLNIKDRLEFSSWVLCPLVEREYMHLCLIPPKDASCPLITSERIPWGYDSALKILCNPHGGWLDNVLDTEHEVDESAVFSMQSYLWKAFGEFLMSQREVLGLSEYGDAVNLVFIANGPFAQLPLSIAENIGHRNGERMLADFFNISYVPSLYCLYSLEKRKQYFKASPSLSFVSNDLYVADNGVNKPLDALDIEKQLAKTAFESNHLSIHFTDFDIDQMLSTFRTSTHWHIASHGKFIWYDLAQSFIQVPKQRTALSDHSGAKQEPSVGKLQPGILSAIGCERFLRLVVLSACETGMSDFQEKELSYESFLTEMLRSGALGVIGSLWPAPEEATALILGRFYHYHIAEGMEPAKALNLSRIWLRDITDSELCAFLEDNLCQHSVSVSAAEKLLSQLDPNDDHSKPFADPWYWACLILVGI